MKHTSTLISILLSTCLGLACAQNAPSTPPLTPQNTQQNTQQNPTDILIKNEITQMQSTLNEYKTWVTQKNASQVKITARKMHQHWLSFENNVRDLYPLLYTDVEKYEAPIFYGSNRTPIDFETIEKQINGLDEALIALSIAKETNENVSEVLQQSVAKYRDYVMEQADSLVQETQKFTNAILDKDIQNAKKYYATARVHYERIEPVAESFGDLDPKIDARLADIESGERWTGFHPLERALWEHNSLEAPEIALLAKELLSDVLSLQQHISQLEFSAKAMVAGAMELLNEAATTKITGEEEAYSRLDLLDFYANVEGAKAVYLAIIPALNVSQKPLVQKLDLQFSIMEEALNVHRQGNDFVKYDSLNTDQIRILANELTKLANLIKETGKIF